MPEKNGSQPPESQKFKDFSDSSLGKQVGHRIEKIKNFLSVPRRLQHRVRLGVVEKVDPIEFTRTRS